jgi:hypothetical protein
VLEDMLSKGHVGVAHYVRSEKDILEMAQR